MPMIKPTYRRSILLLMAAVIALPVLAAEAVDQATTPAQAAAARPESAPMATDSVAVESDLQQAAEKTPAVNSGAPTPITPFKPTEKIEADSAVSFPIDI